MFTRGLSKQTQRNLETLSKIPFVKKYYLAGGTALSLHFGHRFSHDLDFFSQTPEKSFVIVSFLKKYGHLEIFQNEEGTFNGQLNNVKLSFFIYPYKNILPLATYKSIKVASIIDIACMKIDAISSRGTKRDFIDLYSICASGYKLSNILEHFEKKYSGVKFSVLHNIKSLVYFDDAEGDEMPEMIDKVNWNEVKNYFKNIVRDLNYEISR